MERRTAIGAAVAAALAAGGALVAGLLGSGGDGGEAASTTTTGARRTTTSRASTTTSTKPRQRRRGASTTTTEAGPSAGAPTTTEAPTPTTAPPAVAVLTWPQIARVDELAVGSSKTFTFRGSSAYAGSSGALLRTGAASFVAYGPCTHAFGPLKLEGGSLVCQWHGSRFSPADGSVQGGPASTPLARIVLSVSGGVVSYVADST